MINWVQLHVLAFVVAHAVEGTLKASQDHVCLKTEKYEETIFVYRNVPRPVTRSKWCFDLTKGFRCQTTNFIRVPVQMPQVVERTKVVLECCNGYVQWDTECIPHCSGKCVNGQCVQPDTCDCDSGFYGSHCDKSCPSDRWGRNCLEKCDCLNDAECDPANGRCLCPPGWQGDRCQSPCPDGSYGPDCQEKCYCYSLPCHHVTGICYQPVTELIHPNIKVADSLSQPDKLKDDESPSASTTVTNALSPGPATVTGTVPPAESALERDQESKASTTITLATTAPSTTDKHSKEGTLEGEEDAFYTTEYNAQYGEVGSGKPRPREKEITSTSITDNAENAFSSLKPEVEAIGGKDHYMTKLITLKTSSLPPQTPPTSFTTVETTFTGETMVATNSNFGRTEINSYNNNVTDNGNETYSTLDTSKIPDNNNNGEDDDDDDDDDYNGISKTDRSSERRANGSSDIQSVKGETTAEPPEISGKGTQIFSHFNTFRFIPSLSVLTGVSILIIIIGARWLALQHKRKAKKILAKKKEEIFNSRERQKYRESLIIGKTFPEASVYLYEMNLREERPTLQTFKPPPGT